VQAATVEVLGGLGVEVERLLPAFRLTTRQYARLVSEWVSGIGLDPLKYAMHSMRDDLFARAQRAPRCCT
jgi:hypothetical protein